MADLHTRMRSNEEILGRVDLNDPDAILSVTTLDETDPVHLAADKVDQLDR